MSNLKHKLRGACRRPPYYALATCLTVIAHSFSINNFGKEWQDETEIQNPLTPVSERDSSAGGNES